MRMMIVAVSILRMLFQMVVFVSFYPVITQLLYEELHLRDGDGAGVEVGVVGDAEGGHAVDGEPDGVVLIGHVDGLVSETTECVEALIVSLQGAAVARLLTEIVLDDVHSCCSF